MMTASLHFDLGVLYNVRQIPDPPVTGGLGELLDVTDTGKRKTTWPNSDVFSPTQ